jgi:hypothetical protein
MFLYGWSQRPFDPSPLLLLSEDLNIMIWNRHKKGPANGPKKTGPELPAEKYHVDHS